MNSLSPTPRSLVSGVFLVAALFLQSPAGQAAVTSLVLPDSSCPGCTALNYNTNPGATYWACPYEVGPKWSVTVTMQTPSTGTCSKPTGGNCQQATMCDFPGVSISLTNLTGGSLSIQPEAGTESGTPDPQNPPAGGTLRKGAPRTVPSGGSTTFDYLDRQVGCGDYYVCDVSYSSSSCPTACPNGWGSCSIVDVFMVCTECEQP